METTFKPRIPDNVWDYAFDKADSYFGISTKILHETRAIDYYNNKNYFIYKNKDLFEILNKEYYINSYINPPLYIKPKNLDLLKKDVFEEEELRIIMKFYHMSQQIIGAMATKIVYSSNH